MDTDQICDALRGLGRAELERVYAQAAALRALGPASGARAAAFEAPQASGDERSLYEALREHLARQAGLRSTPYHVFRQQPQYAAFHSAAEQVLAWNAAQFKDQSPQQRFSMLGLYADLIAQYMLDHGWPVYWSSVIKGMNMLPAIVDTAFPGYIRAGQLTLVQELRTKGGSGAGHESNS